MICISKTRFIIQVFSLALITLNFTPSLPAVMAAEGKRVAIHVSETTRGNWIYDTWQYWHIYRFLEESLKSDGTPFIEVSDADIVSGALFDGNGNPQFPILISLANEYLPVAAVDQIRDYVNSGGWVYVGSSSWTRDELGNPYLNSSGQPDFALAAEMGLSSNGWFHGAFSATRISESPLLHSGLLPLNTSVKWFMPIRYDLHSHNQTWGSLNFGTHWIWSAVLSPTDPAIGILSPASTGDWFLPSSNFTNWTANDEVYYGDVNGDGISDSISRDKTTSFVNVRISNGQGWSRETENWKLWQLAFDLHIADVTGDGKAEILGRMQGGDNVQVGISTGTTFEPSTQWASWDPSYDMHFADVNGDGRSDIVGRSIGGIDVMVGLSTGNSFSPPTFWSFWSNGYDMHFADVDGDGKDDIVGRLLGGSDVQVGLSSGNSFLPSTHWTDWGSSIELRLADANGDGRKDILGRQDSAVYVGLSSGTSFSPGAFWTSWSPAYDYQFADVNGDSKADIIGRKDDGIDVQVGLSAESPAPDGSPHILLAEKNFGLGKFIYNSQIQPLSSYGGDTQAFQNYKSIRASIDEAFNTQAEPLVRLSAWPYPYQAGLIYRHDHWLNLGIVDVEASYGVRGEYYIQPYASADFPLRVDEAIDKGAIIGAHITGHPSLDWFDYNTSLNLLNNTINDIQNLSGVSPVGFVAPFYEAILQSSMNAIWDAGFKTTGEQGFGPFPSFALDPENEGQYIQTLLQLPVGGIMGQQTMDVVKMEIDLSYDAGGLLNTYDHGGQQTAGGYDGGIANAETMLSYAFGKQNVWSSTSSEIRDWWLQRERRSFTVNHQENNSSGTIDISMSAAPLRAPTPFSDSDIALRIALPDNWLSWAQRKVLVTLDGKKSNNYDLADNELLVRIGSSNLVRIQLGR